jgi:hypothetical protein
LNLHACANRRFIVPMPCHRYSVSVCVSTPQVSFAHGRLAVGLGFTVDHDNELMAADMPDIKGAAHHKLHVGFAARDSPVDIVLRTPKHE